MPARSTSPGSEPAPAPGWLRRASALLAALLAAKVAAIVLRAGDGAAALPPLALPALVHHDLVTVALFVALDFAALLATRGKRRRMLEIGLWSLTALVIGYVAINVPVARLFATPLTYAMLGTAGGELSDSILGYVTLGNLSAIVAVLAAGAIALRWPKRAPSRRTLSAVAASLGIVALLGAIAARRFDTLGLHRNAVSAIAVTGFARLSSPAEVESVGTLPEEGEATDLAHLAGAARGRHVVWIILESTAAEYLGSYGAAPDPTPELTALAKHALVFDKAYSAYPESIKGLLSMLCSLHPAPYTTAADYVHDKLPCRSVAQVLSEAGYRTAFFHSGRFRYLGMQGIVDQRGFDQLHDAQTIGGQYAASFGTDDASTVRRLLEWVDRSDAKRPFFAIYSPISGHHPYKSPGVGPRPFPEHSERDRYYNDLFAGDAAFGELVSGLQRRGLAERTLFVVVGDHGEAFQQHPGNVAHTLYLYEENVRVPMVFAAPGLITHRIDAKQVASLVDIAPTTLAFVGLLIPRAYEGRALLEPRPGLARFQTDHNVLKLGLRQGRWKLVLDTEHDRARLFDLDVDPREQHDISADHVDRVGRYRQHLLEWSEAQRVSVREFAKRAQN